LEFSIKNWYTEYINHSSTTKYKGKLGYVYKRIAISSKHHIVERKLRYYSAKRWVVIERTNSWHNRFRKLLVRYEKKSENYLALVCLACCIIVYRRIILG